eukprot:COSAG06_NODE_65388_length_257_cov_0.645570_1_plen_65_part_10
MAWYSTVVRVRGLRSPNHRNTETAPYALYEVMEPAFCPHDDRAQQGAARASQGCIGTHLGVHDRA